MLGLDIDSLSLDATVKENISPFRGWSMDAGTQFPAICRESELGLDWYGKKCLVRALTGLPLKLKRIVIDSGLKTDRVLTCKGGTKQP